jgi:hypothetical protein
VDLDGEEDLISPLPAENDFVLLSTIMSGSVKEVPSILPGFLIAFVLQDATRTPNAEEIEQIRLQTIGFWSNLLSEEFSKPFMRLELSVNKTIFGELQGEEMSDIGDEFNMCLEMSGQAIFNGKFRGLPSGDEVYRTMVAGDSMGYLVAFVRGIESPNPFRTASEVKARRLKPVTGSPGGTVTCPSFFVAFALDQEDPEANVPDGALPDDLVEEWRKRTHKAMEDNLRKEWPETFESLDLETTLADKGGKKPDSRFHVYIENEASARFSSDPPSPEDVFRVLMKSAGNDSTVYLLSLHDMEGTPFSCVTMVTIQLVGMEMPEPEELPPMEEKEEDQGDEGEPEDKDDGEVASDYVTMNLPIFLALVLNVEPPAETPSDEELLEFKDLMLRFFYTTVKKEYPQIKQMDLKEKETKFGAGQPEARYNMCVEYDALFQFKKDDDIPEKEAIQKMIMEINLSSILAHVKNLEPLCFKHTTEVTMRQNAREKPDNPMIPDPTFEAAVDVPALLTPPQPIVESKKGMPAFASPTEREEPRKKSKEVLKQPEPKPPRARPFPIVKEQPKLSSPEKREEPEKKPDARPRQAIETKKPAPSTPPVVPAPATLIPPSPPDDEKPMKIERALPPPGAQEEPKKTPKKQLKKSAKGEPGPGSEPKPESRKKDKLIAPETEKKGPPLIEPPRSPTSSGPKPTKRVESSDIYCAMQLNRLKGPPSDEQMSAFLANTQLYFEKQLKKHFPRKFDNLQVTFAETAVGLEETAAKIGKGPYSAMNFYAGFVLSAGFRETDAPSSPVKNVVGSIQQTSVTAGLPTPYELTRAIVRDCDVIKFLLEHVRIIEGSDFTSATSCLVQQRVEGNK